MKKKYQSPSLSVYSLHTEGLLAGSIGVGTGEGDVNGSKGFTNKKQQTDMWGNDPNKGIWQ